MTIDALRSAHPASQPDGLAKEARQLVGTLWYNVLSGLADTSMSQDGAGTGQGAFRSMFLWDIAQNDFGQYGTSLVSAIERQAGGAHAGRSAPAVIAPPRQVPLQIAQMAPSAAAFASDAASDVPGEGGISFARRLWPGIKVAASMLGIPAVGLLAQAALESGWGASVPGNNFFGVKAAAGQMSSFRSTHEMIQGQMVPTVAAFRDYSSASASIQDYVSLIRSDFPAVVGQDSVEGFAHALQSGGYATDGAYAQKIVQIAHSSKMADIISMLSGGDGTAEPAPELTAP